MCQSEAFLCGITEGFAKWSVPQCAPQKPATGHGSHHMGSSEDEQDYEKRGGPAKMVWVVPHTVLLPCILWSMDLMKTPQLSKYSPPALAFPAADPVSERGHLDFPLLGPVNPIFSQGTAMA